ncbi:uncharacterized protein [Nicotiana tomentosiformis]|uniref:uncharacterized protein n=1 Tax=Nicotiana tomentosiformis TaxID=4098 RepID=UPI00388C92F2
MGSLSYLQPEKRGIAHEIHQLASLGVWLLDSSDIGISIQDTTTASLVTEVKECQYKDPLLVHYRDTTPQKEKTPFEITEDRVLRYRGRLCVPNIAGLRRQVMGETHYSRYSIHPGATKIHVPALVSTVREQVYRFIEGLNYGIRFSTTRELETDTLYQQMVEITRRLEGMRGREREDMEAKRPRESGGYSGARATVASRHGRGYVSRLVHSTLPASSGVPIIPMSQVAHFAQPLSSAPSARGDFSG